MITPHQKMLAMRALEDAGFPQSAALEVLNGPNRHAFKERELRDEFAIAALNGMLAHATRYQPRIPMATPDWHDAISQEAYELADAMMKARA